MYDNLVATGFLRMAPDATWANITGFVPDRMEVIADEIDVLGSAVMGLTMKCARCHSHKFDPIPQRDYYRLRRRLQGRLRRARLAQAGRPARHRPGQPGRRSAAGICRTSPTRANAQRVGGAERRRPKRQAAGADDSGAVGPRRAVADVHLPPRRLRSTPAGSSGPACPRC